MNVSGKGSIRLKYSGCRFVVHRMGACTGYGLRDPAPNLEGQTEEEYVPSVRSQIDEWLDLEYESFVRTQWDKLVPKEGEAESVQGELVRSILRLEGEY